MKSRLARHALLVVPAMLLAACGGGGGGSDSSPPGNIATGATLVISSSNAKPVAADGLDASTNTGGANAGASLVTGVQVGAGNASSAKLSSVVLALAGKAANRPALATGVTLNETGACGMGGTVSITGNVAGGSGLVAGDTMTITANNCTEAIDSAVATLNGGLTLTVNGGSFNPNVTTAQQVTMSMVLKNLSVASLGVTSVSDGDMKIELSQITASSTNSTLSGASLSNTYTRSGSTRSSALKDYRIVQESTGTQVRTNMTATVVISNPRIGSNVTYQVSTPTPVVTDLSLVLAGKVKVSGNKSSLELSVTSINNFSLQVDSNGDGTFDSTSTVTATELRDLL